MSALGAVALPFAASFLLTRRVPRWRTVPALVAAASLALLLRPAASAMSGIPVEVVYAWVPALGVNASFYVDAFSALFAVIIAGVGLAIFLYSMSYMRGEGPELRYYRLMLFFMGSMLGVALSGNLVFLFLFWEMTTLSSFLLIGLYREEERSIFSALKALAVTMSGGLVLLAAFILIESAAGTYSLPVLLSGSLERSELYPLIVVLVLVGAGAKAAQFPLHFWLPDAMVAPTPVSAYLHSAAMVKAGVFLIGRLAPLLGGTALWETLVPAVGLGTMVIAGFMAIRSIDLKRLLAYSTASHLGLITAMFGWGFATGGVLHLVNHASFKSALFLVAGIVMHETGERSMHELGGLWRSMPVTALLTAGAALSMAGVPPLGGFVSKELFFAASVEGGAVFASLALLGGLLSFAYSLKFLGWTFFGEERVEAHGEPMEMVVPAVLLALPTVIMATGFAYGAVESAAGLVGFHHGEPGLWHGLTPELGLSLATLVVGSALYLGLPSVVDWADRVLSRVSAFTPNAVFERTMNGVPNSSRRVEGTVGIRGLRRRLVFVLAFAGATLVPVLLAGDPHVPAPSSAVPVLVVGLIVVVASVFLLTVESHVRGAVTLGLVGFSVALLFVFAGAPDLALTQILVETLAFIVLLLVISRLPPFYSEGIDVNLGDGVLAGVVGATVFLLAAARPTSSRLSGFFFEKSVEIAGGHNVVNVILVDFRGLDTMGEITVVSIAALGALALLGRRYG